jgi:membrane carboxypeptidase/penicillin-binding protein PbpC
MFGFKIITQYEKGIVFRFGRALPGIRAARLTWFNPFTSRLRQVDIQIVVAAVPGQEGQHLRQRHPARRPTAQATDGRGCAAMARQRGQQRDAAHMT